MSPPNPPDNDGELPLTPTAYAEQWSGLLTRSLPDFPKGAKVTIRPVTDPNLVPDIAGHDPSTTQRIALTVSNPRSTFPPLPPHRLVSVTWITPSPTTPPAAKVAPQ